MRRTNIFLDEKLIDQGKKLTGIKTKKELVNFALKKLVRLEKQKRIFELEGKIDWDGDLESMRSNRGIK